MQSPLVNPIIYLESLLEKVLKKEEHIAIKCHNTPGDNDSGFYEVNSPTMEEDKLLNAFFRWPKHQYGTFMVHIY